jgi:uncharacterized Zn-binding protein involved in type VI secretion
MGRSAVVLNDRITGQCAIHQVPNPSSGAPQPSPGPLPFSAPLTQSLASSVTIEGKPAAVEGSWGVNTPPHVGLHASDPFVVPTSQQGTVEKGSTTVLFEGKGAAMTGQPSTCCRESGQLAGSATTVLVGP